MFTYRAWIESLNKMSWTFTLGNNILTYDTDDITCKEISMDDVYFEEMVSIGLCDKNKKKIFTDDIVKFTIYDMNNDYHPVIIREGVGIIDFTDGSFDIVQLSKKTGHKVWQGVIPELNLVGTYIEFKVLGDIHRNPILLQECVC